MVAMKRKRMVKGIAADAEAGKRTATKLKSKTEPTVHPISILKKKTATPGSSTIPHATTGSKERLSEAPNGLRKLKSAKKTLPSTTHATSEVATVAGDVPLSIQIVAGSYERVVHGVVATVGGQSSSSSKSTTQFSGTFLFNAHTSAIRCVALSPPSLPVPGQGQKVMLATGSTDERINIYNLSAHPPSSNKMSEEERGIVAGLMSSTVVPIAENSKNRELGTLLHHSGAITKLAFPTRSKLLSASGDSHIAVTRTRDWSLLSTIKVPVPKEGTGGSIRRPSGDTAAPGEAPSGVNDFAVHPSMKVMISVSRGERCMRLWNLVTGKKAGVLNFSKDLLRDLGEGKFATGEGRQVVWGRTFGKDAEDATDEYAIGFDRNVVVFGMDSLPRCKVLRDARTKTHDFHYLDHAGPTDNGDHQRQHAFSLLAVSTEDGRILLCSTRSEDLVPAPVQSSTGDNTMSALLPCARLIGQVGGSAVGVTGRVKAFKALPVFEPPTTTAGSTADASATKLQKNWYIAAASSTGELRVWKLTDKELRDAWTNSRALAAQSVRGSAPSSEDMMPKQLGSLLGTYVTGDRLTCLEAFVMIPRPDGVEESDDETQEQDDDSEDED